MAKNTEAHDASEFSLPRPRKLKEFLGEKVIISDFIRREFQGKPFFEVGLIVENTGETVRVNTANKYVFAFFESIPPTACPIQAIFYSKGGQSRSILIKGWNSPDEVEEAEPEVGFDE